MAPETGVGPEVAPEPEESPEPEVAPEEEVIEGTMGAEMVGQMERNSKSDALIQAELRDRERRAATHTHASAN